LSVRQAQDRHVRRRLRLEGVAQGGFPNAWLAGDKDELPLAAQRPVQARTQRLQHILASHQMAGRWG
jgi:hypothetical protein